MFSIKEAFTFGFEKTKNNWLVLMLTALVVIGIGILVSTISKEISHSGLSIVAVICSYLVELFLSLILFKIVLVELSGVKFTPKTAVPITFKKYSSLVCLWILMALFAGLGFVAFILPGIFISVRLSLSTWLLIDRDLAPMDAIKTSWRITEGSFWKILGVGILSSLINFLGLCLIGIGLLFTYPYTLISFGYVYKKLSEREVVTIV